MEPHKVIANDGAIKLHVNGKESRA